MSERQQFLEALLSGRLSMRALCKEFGISEKTGHKWKSRFLAGGPQALADGSHAPLVPPHQLSRVIRDAVVEVRMAHPTWGARKIKAYLERVHPTTTWPAASTITTVCKRAGLVPPRRRRDVANSRWATTHLTVPVAPNTVWATDFKGEFRLRSGEYCYPLTVTDLASRYLLGCEALTSTAGDPVRQRYTQLFQRMGLPQVIRSDNGVPFSQPSALGGLSRLSVWWIRLGIRPERITKGKPTENGSHERMHRTLKAEAAAHPEATLDAQQRRFRRWQSEYNNERPHEALGQTVPAAHYVPSDRPFPKRLPIIEYPAQCILRRISPCGGFSMKGDRHTVSSTLCGEYVALDEQPNDRWRVRYGPLQLGFWIADDDSFEADLEWLDR